MADANRERGASSIPCQDYDSNQDDFDSWILIFENAVNVATNAQTHARQQVLYKQWLPLKLDEEAKAILEQIPADAIYADTISQLKELLLDEIEIYKWKSYQKTIVWDKKESFQALATRVKKAVDKYDKDLNAQGKIWEYFFRFRAALPKTPYQDQIDTSIPKNAKTLENAKELALRVQMTQQNPGDPKQVQFTGAAMSDDRIHALENDMAKIRIRGEEREQERRRRDRRDDQDRNNRDRDYDGNHRDYDRDRDHNRHQDDYQDHDDHQSHYDHHDNHGASSRPLSGRDYRSDQGHRSREYVQDEDPNDWDDETLNAYIESLVAIKNSRQRENDRRK